jgi:hypothetical protein
MGCITPKSELRKVTINNFYEKFSPITVKAYFDENSETMPKRIKELYDRIPISTTKDLKKVDLKFLNLSGKKLYPVEIVLPFYTHIIYLNIWKTSLGDSGCEQLSKILGKLEQLKFLCLADNKISGTGAGFICGKFSFLGQLETLEMQINPLQGSGARCIGKNLPFLGSLKKIGIEECEIDEEAMQDLIVCLSKVKGLERMAMDYNQIGNLGAGILMKVIPSMENLKRIAVQNTGISMEIEEILRNSFPHLLFSIA